MELEKPALANASPGQPITAQAWNKILAAVSSLYDAFDALDAGSTLRVSVSSGGKPVLGARVVASNGTDAVEAVLPFGGSDQYVLGALSAGEWTVHVSSPGLTAKEVAVTLPAAEPVEVALDPSNQVQMPDLFALTGKEVLAELALGGIELQAIYDVTGEELTRSSLQKENADSLVLHQLPPVGTWMDPERDEARILLAAKIVEQQLIAVPDIAGLTLDAAKLELSKVGLELGEVAFVQALRGRND